MYSGKQFVGFKLDELRYVMNMMPFVMDQQTKYILLKIMLCRMLLLGWVQPNLLTLLQLVTSSVPPNL
jgi:hypothetical protein